MNLRRRVHEEDDDDDRDAPLESDRDPSDMLDVVDCPYCGQPISEQAEICPRCGSYISREDQRPNNQAQRMIVGVIVVVLILAMFVALFR